MAKSPHFDENKLNKWTNIMYNSAIYELGDNNVFSHESFSQESKDYLTLMISTYFRSDYYISQCSDDDLIVSIWILSIVQNYTEDSMTKVMTMLWRKRDSLKLKATQK